MQGRRANVLLSLSLLAAVAGTVVSCGGGGGGDPLAVSDPPPDPALVAQGQQIFRFDTFGDEIFWTDVLRMNEVVESGVSPRTALSVGLKVDADALPQSLKDALAAGQVDLDSPATTVALIKLDAVVGLKGQVQNVNGVDRITRLGVTCAVCHSTVDNSFAPGIGRRLDGWPNRDFNSGAVIALSPALTQQQKDVYNSWGPGMYDARFNLDGLSNPSVIPPAYGLLGVHKVTVTGDGDEPAYWNRYVAVTQLGGQGTFTEPRTGVAVTNGTQDLVSSKLPALQAYQLSLDSPTPPLDSFNVFAAVRGQALFQGKAQCATCHSGPRFTDANERLHPKSDSMAEPETPSAADRSATKLYRTSPLRGVWQHAPYFHDGSAATLEAAVEKYNTRLNLGLTAQEVSDVAEYLRSL